MFLCRVVGRDQGYLAGEQSITQANARVLTVKAEQEGHDSPG